MSLHIKYQGKVQKYGTISELASQSIDTKQLLGLIRSKDAEDEDQDNFTYEDDSRDHSDADDGMFNSVVQGVLYHYEC